MSGSAPALYVPIPSPGSHARSVTQPQRPPRRILAQPARDSPQREESRAPSVSESPAPFNYMYTQGSPASTSPVTASPSLASSFSAPDVWGGMGNSTDAPNGFSQQRSPRGPTPKQPRAMFGTQRGLQGAIDRRGPAPAGFISKPDLASSPPTGSVDADSSSEASQEGASAEEGPKSTAPKGDKRTHIVREIISTEKSYVSAIELLVKVFQPALRILINDPQTALKVDDVRRMFSNIDMIIPLNKELLKDLEARQAAWGPDQLIGDVFLTHAPYLKVPAHVDSVDTLR